MKKIFKKIFLTALFFCAFYLCACDEDVKPFIIMDNKPIEETTVGKRHFNSGTRVYYAAVNPKGFEDKVIKVQIFKKDEKVASLGYSYYSNKNEKLKNQQYFTDYFVIHQTGLYVMQVFNITNLNAPVAITTFWIQ